MDFWFDIVCPFAYLASTRVEALAAKAGRVVRWRPILLGGLLRDLGTDTDPNATMAENKRRLVRADMLRQAAWLGEPLTIPAAHPQRTVDVMRVISAAPAERVPDVARAAYRAYWVEGVDVSARSFAESLADQFGIDRAAIDARETKDRLRAETTRAQELGVFGVPTIRVDGELYWGVDRMDLVARQLGVRPRLRFFHDFASPYAYLASARVETLAAEAGADLEWRPILVGALFKDIGTPLVPLATFSEAKQAYQRRDMERQAERYGLPFRFPSSFPIRSVAALRVSIVEPRAVAAIYRAAWGQDRPVGDAEHLRRVLDEAGFDGATLLARTDDPAVKDRLRENTDLARTIGAYGVPTFQVDDGPLFFGQDRMDQVALALRGWRPPHEEAPQGGPR